MEILDKRKLKIGIYHSFPRKRENWTWWKFWFLPSIQIEHCSPACANGIYFHFKWLFFSLQILFIYADFSCIVRNDKLDITYEISVPHNLDPFKMLEVELENEGKIGGDWDISNWKIVHQDHLIKEM